MLSPRRSCLKVCFGFFSASFLALIVDLAFNPSVFNQYFHILTCVALSAVAVLAVDVVIVEALENRECSRLRNFIECQLLGDKKTSSPLQISPKRRQRLLQAEIENFVQGILDDYIRVWAAQVGQTQTLDKEVENDLRRVLSEICDTLIRDFKWERVLKEALILISPNPPHGGKFSHPVSLGLSKKKEYLMQWTERVLVRFGVDKVISGRTIFDCLCDILTEQVTLRVFHSCSDPDSLRDSIEIAFFGRILNKFVEPISDSNFLSDKDNYEDGHKLREAFNNISTEKPSNPTTLVRLSTSVMHLFLNYCSGRRLLSPKNGCPDVGLLSGVHSSYKALNLRNSVAKSLDMIY